MKILLCDSNEEMYNGVLGIDVVNSPVLCLHQAITMQPELIVVTMRNVQSKERMTQIELCSILKENKLSKEIPILVLLDECNKRVFELLQKAGVDYASTFDLTEELTGLNEFIKLEFDPEYQLSYQLKQICPKLNYSRIDSQRELTVCGAYLDRMVLGGNRLHDICLTKEHYNCPYYLNPRCIYDISD